MKYTLALMFSFIINTAFAMEETTTNCLGCNKEILSEPIYTHSICDSTHKFHIICLANKLDKTDGFKCPLCNTQATMNQRIAVSKLRKNIILKNNFDIEKKVHEHQNRVESAELKMWPFQKDGLKIAAKTSLCKTDLSELKDSTADLRERIGNLEALVKNMVSQQAHVAPIQIVQLPKDNENK